MSLSPADIGHRVVVRRIVSGPGAARPQFSDLLGELLELDAELRLVVLRTDAGEQIAVPVEQVAAAKRVPPRRTLVAHTTVAAAPPVNGERLSKSFTYATVAAPDTPVSGIPDLELERIAALGWRGRETERLGDWLLRAADGWTGRANSVLPLGDPGRPLDAALEHVNAWYAARGLPPTIQVPLPAAESLRDALVERGWAQQWGALVLTAEVDSIRAQKLAVAGIPAVTVAPEPSEDWLAAYHYRGGPLPPTALAVLRAAATPGFAAIRDQHGTPLAICRLVVDEGWVGITAVEVAPEHRRRGLATHLLAGAIEWAAQNTARGAYLQVEPGNTTALAMYEKVGFRVHHEYRYYRP